uniref:Transthyretin-like family protein n=1 Tax=Plectus sambesii TaxID=2011161 RepID=A0A914VDT1_9BILA
MNRLAISVLLLACVSFCAAFRLQSVGARGTLKCGSRPLANTRVKLWDEDDGIDPDDELASAMTDSQGRFELSGSTREMTPIDARLKIYHDCDDTL